MSRPRIAIPQPHSSNPDYNDRALPQYVAAIDESGADAVIIALNSSPAEIARIVTSCDGILLPGSPADIDPQKYGVMQPDPRVNPADAPRDVADELLLQDAYNMRKPIFGICYGLQSLNVWRTGTLLPHIESAVNHEAGRDVKQAHEAALMPDSCIAQAAALAQQTGYERIAINSSHHQAADVVGDGLRVTARCPDDGIIEAIEGTTPHHFVVAVQWHPERTFDNDAVSRYLFRLFVEAAAEWKPVAPRLVQESAT